MNDQTSEALRAWFKRVEPMYPELFNTAHVICGNYDQAEYALRSAILDVWTQNADSGMGFREKLRSAVRAEALQAFRVAGGTTGEMTWPGFQNPNSELMRLASRERVETQRLLMLRHGVGLPVKRVAQLSGMTASQARTALDRFESRCRRSLPSQERSRFSALFSRQAKAQLASRSGIPHPAGVYRAFEAEASGLQLSEHRVTRIVYRIVLLLLALVCAGMFWLFAVLVQAPQAQSDATPPVEAAQTDAGGAAAPTHIETTFETEGR